MFNNDWFKDKIITKKDRKIFYKILSFLLLIPLRIGVSPKWWKKNNEQTKILVRRSVEKISSHEYAFIPAGFAFYLFTSFIPVLILSISLINIHYKDDDTKKFIFEEIISRYIPAIDKIFDFNKNESEVKNYNLILSFNKINIILLISSLWISSTGYAKFITSQSIIYGHKNQGNWFINRMKGLIIVTVISIFFAYLLLSATFIFKKLDVQIENKSIYIFLFYLISSFYIIFFFFIVWFFLLKYTPTFKTSFKNIKPGVIISSLASTLFSTIFGYLSSIKIIDYNKFGIFATFLYLSTFTLFISYILYFGIIINEAFYKSFVSDKTKNKYRFQNKKI
ncbi:YhjD/YihY/BrkB family envelope integrity protein [Mesomycoplasma neurolyticum]|uniref:Ribonuclease BN-like family n=1 Tax=Mesomycoplasma neurolyticum TaxID=2120 RepID=A0A449A4P5_9BACT|nr:YhjD/YihY/BrkB family envelope integrity protein [Mesomycoplasma neurolyticum]VEU59215.1 Ribonuclease BN-like family [Mesomycoplasma neurolyticum]